MAKLYECTNENCILGSTDNPGYFTEGMTQAQKNLKTGQPVEQMEEGKDYGEGICPECGQPAEVMEIEHESLVGEDSHDELHQKVAEKLKPTIDELREKYTAGEISPEQFAEQLAEISDEAQFMVTEGVEAK